MWTKTKRKQGKSQTIPPLTTPRQTIQNSAVNTEQIVSLQEQFNHECRNFKKQLLSKPKITIKET